MSNLLCFSCGDNYYATVGVLIGNGNGTFQPAVIYDLGSQLQEASSIVIADVNSDGKPDLLVTAVCTSTICSGDGVVGVLLGNGDGTFQPAVTYDSGGYGPASLAVGDMNGDGKLDLVVANGCGGAASCDGAVAVLLGNGDGTFKAPTIYGSVMGGAVSVALADVNADGKLDALVSYSIDCGPGPCGSSTGVLLGNGDGTFRPFVTYSGIGGGSVTAADVNGDGKPDLVVSAGCPNSDNCGYGFVGVLLGNGDGTFQPQVTYNSGGYEADSVAVADVNGDGVPDLVVANGCGLFGSSLCENSNVAVLLGKGDGTFQTATIYGSGGTNASSVTTRDVNGDGKIDIVVADACYGCNNGAVAAVLFNNSGAVTTATAITSSPNPSVYLQSVTFAAKVTSRSGTPTGIVTFYSGVAAIGSAALVNGKASLSLTSLPMGRDSITAAYQGAPGFAQSTSSILTQSVLIPTRIELLSSPNPSYSGQSVTFIAWLLWTYGSGAPPNGELVTFYNGSAAIGAAPLDPATFTISSLPVGVLSITASYGGDLTYAPSTSLPLTQAVIATTTTLASSLNPSIYGQEVRFTATVTTTGSAPPTGKVLFTWSGYNVGSAILNSSGVAALTNSNLNADYYPLTAVYLGDANNPGSKSIVLNQVVKETTSAARISSSPNPSVQGEAVTFTAKITSPTVTATGPVTFTAGKTVLGTAQLSFGKAKFTTSTMAVGSTTVKATYYGDSNITRSSASVTQTVQQ